MKILIPTSIALDLGQPAGVEVVRYSPLEPIPSTHHDAQALVVWGNSREQLRDAATRLHSLRWVQALSAGAEPITTAGFAENVILTSGQTLHDRPVAEHALALILAAARRLHTSVRAQIGHRWAGEIGGLQPEPNPEVFTTLRGARVLIWGFGGIARTIAPHLIGLGATVVGVGRSDRVENGVTVVSAATLDVELARADVVLMILPSTAETHHTLSAERLALLSPTTWVINVGRGNAIDEVALLTALREQRIGGAALDVTSVEPLPPTSGFWDQPNVIITPHAAGGRPLAAAELILENLGLLAQNLSLRNVVVR